MRHSAGRQRNHAEQNKFNENATMSWHDLEFLILPPRTDRVVNVYNWGTKLPQIAIARVSGIRSTSKRSRGPKVTTGRFGFAIVFTHFR